MIRCSKFSYRRKLISQVYGIVMQLLCNNWYMLGMHLPKNIFKYCDRVDSVLCWAIIYMRVINEINYNTYKILFEFYILRAYFIKIWWKITKNKSFPTSKSHSRTHHAVLHKHTQACAWFVSWEKIIGARIEQYIAVRGQVLLNIHGRYDTLNNQRLSFK